MGHLHSVTDSPFKSIEIWLVGIETMLVISKPSSLLTLKTSYNTMVSFYAIEEWYFKVIQLTFIFLKPFERFGSLSDPVGTSTSTSYTLPSHLTTIARSWVLLHKKERI